MYYGTVDLKMMLLCGVVICLFIASSVPIVDPPYFGVLYSSALLYFCRTRDGSIR